MTQNSLEFAPLPIPSPWFPPKPTAEYLGVAYGTLAKWRLHPESGGPRFYRMPGGLVRYKRSDLDDWLNAHPGGAAEGPRRRPNAGRPSALRMAEAAK